VRNPAFQIGITEKSYQMKIQSCNENLKKMAAVLGGDSRLRELPRRGKFECRRVRVGAGAAPVRRTPLLGAGVEINDSWSNDFVGKREGESVTFPFYLRPLWSIALLPNKDMFVLGEISTT